jgi:hypothetical protein
VLFYQHPSGRSPVVDWLEAMKRKDPRSFAKCAALIRRLGHEGHELRRPAADYLRDGIHELRARRGRSHHRLLYFFHDKDVAVIDHALTKEAGIPAADMERAIERRKAFESDPRKHTYEGEVD